MRMLVLCAAAALAVQAAPPGARNAGTRNAIAGRVTTPDGSPLAGAVVTLLERDAYGGPPHVVDMRLQIVTDADGRYAIPQARLGEFFVVAIPHNAMRTPDGRVNRSGCAITYFPSARSVDQATPVMVNVREAQTADITLRASPLFVVSGTVFDSKDAVAPGARVLIGHGDPFFGIDNAAASVRPDGTFALAGMLPGAYFLQYREGTWPPPRGNMGLVSMATVVVGDRDVSGVRVAPIHPAQVEGRVIVADADRAALPPDLTITVTPVSFAGNPGPRPPGRINADLTFTVRTWPGMGRINVSPRGAGWSIRRVRYRGADVTDMGIDFADGGTVTGIDVELVRAR
jgi:hypothetical protein